MVLSSTVDRDVGQTERGSNSERPVVSKVPCIDKFEAQYAYCQAYSYY